MRAMFARGAIHGSLCGASRALLAAYASDSFTVVMIKRPSPLAFVANNTTMPGLSLLFFHFLFFLPSNAQDNATR